MEQSKIDRINELTAISRERELTEDEKSERESLRREYIDSWRQSTISVLENTYIVDNKGFKRKLEKKNEKHRQ